MIIVADEQVAESARAAGQLVCPVCGGRLRKHGFSRPRSVRTYGGAHRTLRPARVRCAEPACGRTHVLLPAWCVPGRGVDADTIGAALLAAANGKDRIDLVVLGGFGGLSAVFLCVAASLRPDDTQ